MQGTTNRFVIVNRDAVLLRRPACGEVFFWGQEEFRPRALEGLRLLTEHGVGVLMACRQECATQRLLNPNQVRRMAQRLRLEVALSGGKIEKVYCCGHAEKEGCDCRFAANSVIHRALMEFGLNAAETLLISDSREELEFSATEGCPGILLQGDAFLRAKQPESAGPEIASSLYEAAKRIVSRKDELGPEGPVSSEWTAQVEAEFPAQPCLSRDALDWQHHGWGD